MFKEAFKKICNLYGVKVSDEIIDGIKKYYDDQEDTYDKYKRSKNQKTYLGRGRFTTGKTPETNRTPKYWSGRVFDLHDQFADYNTGDTERST